MASVGTALVLWTVFFYKGAYAVLPVYLPVPGMQTDRIPFLLNDHFWRCQLLSPATTVKYLSIYLASQSLKAVSIKRRLRTADCGLWTADCGPGGKMQATDYG